MSGAPRRAAAHHLQQRVLVRMLFDERFAERLRRDPDWVLAGLDLPPEAIRELASIDRRALAVDPLRRRRTLKTLFDEYRISSTLVLLESRRLGALEAFFGSDPFHRAIMERGSIALAFGEFLGQLVEGRTGRVLTTPGLADVVRYERALVRGRRAPRWEGPEGGADGEVQLDDATLLELAPGVSLESFQLDVLALVNEVERYLFEVGLVPVTLGCEDAPRLSLTPVRLLQPLELLFVPTAGRGASGVTLQPLEPELAALVRFVAAAPDGADRPARSTRELVAWLGGQGLGPRGAEALLAEWLDEGVLVARS